MALHSTEALMAGFLKSTDLGGHPHSYGAPHHPHHSHGPPLPPGMPMSMTPFGLPHGLDAVGFPHQGMWGKYCFQFSIPFIFKWFLYFIIFMLWLLMLNKNRLILWFCRHKKYLITFFTADVINNEISKNWFHFSLTRWR